MSELGRLERFLRTDPRDVGCAPWTHFFRDIRCATWTHFFLKWTLADPAVVARLKDQYGEEE